MTNGLAPVLFTTCGVVVAGLVGFAFLEQTSEQPKPSSLVAANNSLKSEPSKKTEAQITNKEATAAPADTNEAKPKKTIKLSRLNFGAKKPSQEASRKKTVKAPDNQSAKKSDQETIAEPQISELPRFNVITVDKDGSMVVAGQGPKKVLVELKDDKKSISSMKTNANGDFVFALDRVLKPGAHQLYLQLKNEEGKILQSPSFAFVDIPEKGELGEVTVLLAQAGKPSKLVQKPKAAKIETAANTSDEKTAESVLESEASSSEADTKAKPNSVVSNTASASVELAKPEPVFIEAVDVENSKIYIAGTGEPDTSVNLYFENDYLGSTQVADNGAFLFEGTKTIKPGRYDIRADMISKDSSKPVEGRAEVKLVHKPSVTNSDTLNEEQKVAGLPNTQTLVDSNTSVQSDQTDLEGQAESQDATQKPEITSGSAVIIRRGDSLWTVARRNYGAGIRYTTIFDANRDQVRNPHRIYPGQVLKIPETESSGN